MNNTLEDLNNHLFAQMERLSDESLTTEDLDRELKRSEGITNIAEQIIRNGELAYKAASRMAEYGGDRRYIDDLMPDMLQRHRRLTDGKAV